MADENKKLTSDDERKYMRALEKDERAFKDLKKED